MNENVETGEFSNVSNDTLSMKPCPMVDWAVVCCIFIDEERESEVGEWALRKRGNGDDESMDES
jgi:hypothetical protein